MDLKGSSFSDIEGLYAGGDHVFAGVVSRIESKEEAGNFG